MQKMISELLAVLMFFVAMTGVLALIVATITGQVEDTYR